MLFSGFPASDAVQKEFNKRIGHGYEIVFSPRMNPCIDNLIHCSQDEPLDKTQIQAFADPAFLLTQLYDFGHQIHVHVRHFFYLLINAPRALVGFGLIEDRHVRVPLKFFQMPANQIPELVHGISRPVHLFAETPEDLSRLIVEKVHQDIIFILEIQIDSTISHTGFTGYLGDGGLEKALLGKNLDSGLEYSMIFFVCFSLLNDSTSGN